MEDLTTYLCCASFDNLLWNILQLMFDVEDLTIYHRFDNISLLWKSLPFEGCTVHHTFVVEDFTFVVDGRLHTIPLS